MERSSHHLRSRARASRAASLTLLVLSLLLAACRVKSAAAPTALPTTVVLVAQEATATASSTPTAADTPRPTDSPTATASATATLPTTATSTATSAPSATPSATPLPTDTPTPTATATPLPGVVASYPIDGDRAVPLEARILLALERPVERQRVTARFDFSPALQGRITWPDGARVAFEPTELLTNTTYAMTATLSAAGLGLTTVFTATFETGTRGVPIPILMYHRLRDLPPDASQASRDWSVAPANLAKQLDHLVQRGYRTIDFEGLLAYVEQREPLPPRPVIISMDDGYREVMEVAWPLLAERGQIANLFVLPPYVEYPLYMNWEQLATLRKAGHYFGSHSMTHPDLRRIPAAEAEREVRDSKALIEERLGQPVAVFCYPMGAYNNSTIELLKRYGYRAACTLAGGYYQQSREDGLFRLKRVRVAYDTTLEQFAEALPW